jgi:hypothetical protein
MVCHEDDEVSLIRNSPSILRSHRMSTKQGRFFKVVAVSVIIIDKKTKSFHLYTFSFIPNANYISHCDGHCRFNDISRSNSFLVHSV